jgi:transcription antitermination protein NusB
MLNRRHLRIRVLQFVYSWKKSNLTDIVVLEKQFLKSLNKVEELYLFLLLYILEVRDFAENYSEDSKKKQLPTDNDLNPNTKFINNLFLSKLRDESVLIGKAGHSKLSFADENNMIKSIYFKMVESEVYISYMNEEIVDFETDKKFIVKLFSKVLIEMEVFQDFLSEQDIFWDDDFPFICSMVIKTIKDSTTDKIELFELFKDTDEKDFAVNLLRQSIIHSEEFAELISSKTKNWDLDRVAQMDLILMQMALSELLKMPSVPVKVTINEYIELAKYYSTPNSKNFVNGILDSLLIELKREGAIKKMGRGLIE